MLPATRDEQKKEAFRLFEDGRYLESLQVCTKLLETEKDQAIEILLATNLFSAGKLGDAEACFRDLREKMPDSSYVHSYLAKVLEARGDDGAIAEYAAAVHLDPENQDALRSYAGYLLSRRDFRGALPVLRRLVSLGRKDGDIRNLVRTLAGVGRPAEALTAHRTLAGDKGSSQEYLDALILTGDFRMAAAAALEAYRQNNEPALLRKYLSALSRYDPKASLEAYRNYMLEISDCDILADYAVLLAASGEPEKALDTCSLLVGLSPSPAYRLFACSLTAEHGDPAAALAMYEQLIGDELRAKNDLSLLARIIGNYRDLLVKTGPADKAFARFLEVVAGDPNVASLVGTARFCENLGNMPEARSWYYRAYRADFLNGGLEYARFLADAGECRECEKVMLYILNNVKRSQDLYRVAKLAVDDARRMFRMQRLMDDLIRRLDERRMSLDTDGLELLANVFLTAARRSLAESDFAGCKRFCLKGIDVLPVPTGTIQLEDFLLLIKDCKERAIADRPVMDRPVIQQKVPEVPVIQQIRDELDLDDPEQKIVEFLRSHKRATEIELRKALGTRRVAGLVNRLIRKAAEKNMTILTKRGVGEDGEIYEYAGN